MNNIIYILYFAILSRNREQRLLYSYRPICVTSLYVTPTERRTLLFSFQIQRLKSISKSKRLVLVMKLLKRLKNSI